MNEQRNLVLAIGLSIAILLGFQIFYEGPRQQQRQAEQAQQQATLQTAAPGVPGGQTVPTSATTPLTLVDREDSLRRDFASGRRIPIVSPKLHGSVNLVGGRLDDLTLAQYHETADTSSPEIVLLAPAGTARPYYAEFGWVPQDASLPAPGPATVWSTSGTQLTPEQPLTLTWDNGAGLVFERVLSVDENYMFSLVQKVHNTSDKPVTLLPYSLVSRHGTPETSGYYILHEGPLGVIDGKLREHTYKDLKDKFFKEHSNQPAAPTVGGWIGITDKYWLAALVPDQAQAVQTRFLYSQKDGQDRYQVDTLGDALTVPPGGNAESGTRLFAGAKQVHLLDRYASQLNITKFDLAIDFGWFYFLTKPFFYCLDFLGWLIGNFGVAILVFTVIVKALFFPLANKSYVSMSKMKKVQPEMMQLKERYENDKERLNLEMMRLYKREKINPLSGCLPILIQIPVFFALYKVLFVTIEMRQAPFFGWIQDLSQADPTNVFNLFGLIPWDPPSMLTLGAWPLIMGISMWLQQKLNPAPPDPVQQKVFMFLPILFTFMLAHFPAGLVIYWAWNNTLSILQQWLIMRKMGVKVNP